jgi:Secretion system C-terminal sorting domain
VAVKNNSTDSTFERRLLSYSLAAGTLFAGAGDLNAQIKGETLNQTLTKNSVYYLNFTGAGTRFQLGIRTAYGTYYAVLNYMTNNASCVIYNNNNYVAAKLINNDVVSNAKPFRRAMATLSKFAGQGDQYIGVRFKISSSTYYGWIKINLPSGFSYYGGPLKIISYAYNSTAGSSITCNGVLPVELTSFTAALSGSAVSLKWQTATEINNYGFNVERLTTPLNPPCQGGGQGGNPTSPNAVWETLGFVKGNGNSNSPKDYGFTDPNPPVGTVVYRLKQIDIDGAFKYSNQVSLVNTNVPEFKLSQNYPNPFNPTTTIRYSIPEESRVTIKVYNMLGAEVATLINENKAAGNHQIDFDGSKLASGTYVYKIQTDKYSASKKFLLLK